LKALPFATQCGRDGCRRIRRLWLNDDSCVRLIDAMPLENVTSRFAMERIKSTTAYLMAADIRLPRESKKRG
jgi:hypothetical protein